MKSLLLAVALLGYAEDTVLNEPWYRDIRQRNAENLREGYHHEALHEQAAATREQAEAQREQTWMICFAVIAAGAIIALALYARKPIAAEPPRSGESP